MLNVHYLVPPFPRSWNGKFHILFAHLRQLHLTACLLRGMTYDVYFVDQLSTCVPFLRLLGHTRVVFYCHFPDKLLANGAFVEGNLVKKNDVGFLKWLYRLPMDWLEEVTTSEFIFLYLSLLLNATHRAGGRDSCQFKLHRAYFQVLLPLH
jgi:alpha-1,3/alpha-1,6-mannosyltransferase